MPLTKSEERVDWSEALDCKVAENTVIEIDLLRLFLKCRCWLEQIFVTWAR